MFDTVSIIKEHCQTADQAREYVMDYLSEGESGYHGFVEVAASRRNWIFLVRRDGGVVAYEG